MENREEAENIVEIENRVEAEIRVQVENIVEVKNRGEVENIMEAEGRSYAQVILVQVIDDGQVVVYVPLSHPQQHVQVVQRLLVRLIVPRVQVLLLSHLLDNLPAPCRSMSTCAHKAVNPAHSLQASTL